MSEWHTMVISLHGEKADLWYCPTCGRMVTVQYQPYKQIVLDDGDLLATHTGGKGGASFSDVHIVERDREDLP